MDRNQQTWATIGEFVGTLGLAASLFGGAQLAGVLTLGSQLIGRGAAGYREIQALTAQVQGMVDEGRAPTAEEWAVLDAQISDASSRIRSLPDSRPDQPRRPDGGGVVTSPAEPTPPAVAE